MTIHMSDTPASNVGEPVWTPDNNEFPAPSAPDAESGAPTDESFTGSDPRWTRWAIWGLLGLTTLLYVWALDSNGWANSFYSAAVQAGTESWKALFYGSSDAANSITVDKPPASLWVMALSARVFGLNYWSLLLPQAAMGVASVGLLYLAVKRWYGKVAGLIAGAALALTPVAVLMFRFNNPDALLVLLLVAAAYAVTRAIEKASPWWLMLAGTFVGLGFITKMAQAFLVLPAFVLAYVISAPTGLGKRIRDLALAFVAMIVAGGWWVAIVELVPASSRPYIGGSQNNSIVELILGYNGIGRLTGNETGSVGPGAGGNRSGMTEALGGLAAGPGGAGGGPGGGGPGFGGSSGLFRLFAYDWAGQIAWLLPAAAILLLAGLWFTRRQPRIGRLRAGLIIWGGWALVTWATFSFASGIIHQYYAVALAPALAALVGIGAVLLWRLRQQASARWLLAGTLAVSALYAMWLLVLAGGWYSAIGALVAVLGLSSAVLIGFNLTFSRRITAVIAAAGMVSILAGPAAFAIQTVSTDHSGSLVTAGPNLGGVSGGPGGARGPGQGPGGMAGPGGIPGQATAPGGTAAGGSTPGGTATGQGRAGGGMGGLLNAPTVGSEVVAVLNEDAQDFTWVAAGIGSMSTAGYQLATGNAVMPVGGFNGTDPSPTLEQFKQYVAAGKIHYFIGGGGFGPGMNGSSSSSEIGSWVTDNFTSRTVDGVTLYDLTQPTSSTPATTEAATGTA